MPRFVLWIFLAGGLLGTIFVGWRVATSAYLGFRGPATPRTFTAEGAPEREYIRLEGAVPRCETRAARDGMTFWLADAGEVPVLVQRMDDVPCAPGPVEGGFLPGTYDRAFLKERAGLPLPPGGDVRVFTEALTPAVQRGVVYRTLPWLVLSIALAAIGLKGVRQRAA